MPPCLVLPVAIVRRREPREGLTWYAWLNNTRRPLAIYPSEPPDPPRSGDFNTRAARWQTAYYIQPPAGAPMADGFAVNLDGRLYQPSPTADTPLGITHQPQAERSNVLRRPTQPFGNRLGVNILV